MCECIRCRGATRHRAISACIVNMEGTLVIRAYELSLITTFTRIKALCTRGIKSSMEQRDGPTPLRTQQEPFRSSKVCTRETAKRIWRLQCNTCSHCLNE